MTLHETAQICRNQGCRWNKKNLNLLKEINYLSSKLQYWNFNFLIFFAKIKFLKTPKNLISFQLSQNRNVSLPKRHLGPHVKVGQPRAGWGGGGEGRCCQASDVTTFSLRRFFKNGFLQFHLGACFVSLFTPYHDKLECLPLPSTTTLV